MGELRDQTALRSVQAPHIYAKDDIVASRDKGSHISVKVWRCGAVSGGAKVARDHRGHVQAHQNSPRENNFTTVMGVMAVKEWRLWLVGDEILFSLKLHTSPLRHYGVLVLV